MFDLPKNAILVADSAAGIYIPLNFAESHDPQYWDFSKCWSDSIDVLKRGPDGPEYLEAWVDVLDNATTVDGRILWQDGDLWLINPDDIDWES